MRLGYKLIFLLVLSSCNTTSEKSVQEDVANDKEMPQAKVKLMTLDPGHFHAYLVQKSTYQEVDSTVHVYAPNGPELDEHLIKIDQFNHRSENPTNWVEEVYRGDDYLEKMLTEKPGNVMMVAGNNAKKTKYIHEAVKAGINVLADKPMVIFPEDLELLQDAFKIASSKGLLIYDIMTERFEITTMLQKEFAQIATVFGELEMGTAENPAISKESVHHFYKYVAGNPLKRPAWFFDIEQEGAGIVDVSTHLVDLILWECFPEQPIYESDVEVLNAKKWATNLSNKQFEQVTGIDKYPEYLKKYVKGESLAVLSNGEFVFKTKGVHGKVSVVWNFQAPEGAKDTHYSIMRGSLANLVIKQDKEQNYKPTLYIEPVDKGKAANVETALQQAIDQLSKDFPGISTKASSNGWELIIPDELRKGHEAHFKQVTEKYLKYLEIGELPDWETQNMLTKYFITMEAYKKSQ